MVLQIIDFKSLKLVSKSNLKRKYGLKYLEIGESSRRFET